MTKIRPYKKANGRPWYLGGNLIGTPVPTGTPTPTPVPVPVPTPTPVAATGFALALNNASGLVGVAQPFTISPVPSGSTFGTGKSALMTATTLTGTFSATSIALSGTAAATGTFTPTAAGGPGTISATVSGLADNSTLQARTFTASASGGSGPVMLSTFALENFSTGASSKGFARQGVPIKKGDVPTGYVLEVRRGGNVVPAQFDERTTWADGSVKFAVMHLRDADFAASESRTYEVWSKPGAWDNSTSKTLADVTAGRNINLAFTSLTETGDSGTAAVGSGAFTATMNTHLAVATRRERYHAGAVCVGYTGWGMAADNTGGAADAHLKTYWYHDAWLNADGSIYAVEVGAVPSQDWWSIPNKRRRNYTATLKDGSTTIATYTGVQHPHHSQWITCINDGGLNRGKRHWVGGAMPTLVYKPSKAYWYNTKIMPALNPTRQPTGTYVGSGNNAAYVPCGAQDHRAGINGTGAYIGRGIVSNADSLAYQKQTAADTAAARINAHAGLHMPTHWRSNRTRTRPGDGGVADVASTPVALRMAVPNGVTAPAYDFTADGMPVPVLAYVDYDNFRSPTEVSDSRANPQGGTGVWSFGSYNDGSHTPNPSYYMYLLEGERYHLEALLTNATYCVHQLIGNQYGGQQSGFDSICGLFENQIRNWSPNIIGSAAGLAPDSHVAKRHMMRLAQQQGLFLQYRIAAMPPSQVASSITPGYISTDNWQTNFTALCLRHAARLTEDANMRAAADMLTNMTIIMVNTAPGLTNAYGSCCFAKTTVAPDETTNPATTQFLSLDTEFAVNTTTDRVTPSSYNAEFSIANGDILRPQSFLRNTNPANTNPDLVIDQLYYLVNVSGNTAQISATLGGAPINFTSNAPFTARVLFTGMKATVQGSETGGVGSADHYPSIAQAALIDAYNDGYTPATQTLVQKLMTYNGPLDLNNWTTWDYAPKTV